MATIYFLYRSSREQAPLTVRLQDHDKSNKKFQFQARTELEVSKLYWKTTRHKKRNVDAVDKSKIAEVNTELSNIENYLLSKYKEDKPEPQHKNWLKEVLEKYYNPKTEEVIASDLITDWIQNVIDNANTRENATGSLGLSPSRIKSYQTLLNIFERYQGRKRYRVKDVDIKFGKNFLTWLLNSQNYSEGYAKKRIDDLKTVCSEAEIHGVETSRQLKRVKGGKTKNEYIIYLTLEELKKIEDTEIDSESLKNARKWLILGCSIGQRGGDLLKLTEKNFTTNEKGLEVIELKQQKTGKVVNIPVLPKTREIFQQGLPYKIAIQNFNNELKTLCKVAGIDSIIPGSKIAMINDKGEVIEKDENGKYKEKGNKRKITGTFPKYELITSHVCRRSFATNHYGKIDTPILMQVTAHSTEKMFHNYIGKTPMDYAQQFADLYAKLNL